MIIEPGWGDLTPWASSFRSLWILGEGIATADGAIRIEGVQDCMELVAHRIGESSVKVSLFDQDKCRMGIWSLESLRQKEEARYELAALLLKDVRSQMLHSSPHWVHIIAQMIESAIKEFK